MERKSFVKVLVLAGILCLVLGMATGAMAETITNLAITSISTDGTVGMSCAISPTGAKEVTVKVMDSTNIVYIDQKTTSAVNGTVSFSFKLKDATTSLAKTYSLFVGGTGVSTAVAKAIFKPATLVAQTVLIDGPNVIASTLLPSPGPAYFAKAVDSSGVFVTGETTWVLRDVSTATEGTTVKGITVSGTGVLSGTYASIGAGDTKQLVIKATIGGITGSKTILIGDITPVKDPLAGTVTTIGSVPAKKMFSGVVVARQPLTTGSATLTLPVDTTYTNYETASVLYFADVYNSTGTLVKTVTVDKSTGVANLDTGTPLVAGRYKVIYRGTANAGASDFQRVMYVGIAPTDTAILRRTGDTAIRAGDKVFKISGQDGLVTGTDPYVDVTSSGLAVTVTLNNIPSGYKYKVLYATANDEDGNGVATKMEGTRWVVARDWTGTTPITFNAPASGTYLVSVYARNDYSGEYVDAYRIKTVTVSN